MADPGTHAGITEEDGILKMLVSVVITFMGIFYFAVILALIVDWVRDRMDSIKKGKGYIVEDGHFLILGMYTFHPHCLVEKSKYRILWYTETPLPLRGLYRVVR